jgi:acylphosphatase
MHRVHLVVHGRVQGVGFRAFVIRHARSLAVGGEVSNLPDGAVEIMAEGPAEALSRLVDEVRRGPVAARVAGVDVSWSEGDGRYRGFEIRG